MTFSAPLTARAKRVLRADHIRGMLIALAAWKALTAEQRANLVESMRRDDLSPEGQAGAKVLASISVTLRTKETNR